MRHPYTSHDACVARLLEWHEKNGRIIVAFDFDNTVFDYHAKGHDYTEVIELLRRAKRAGCFLIVFTGNPDTPFIERFLCEHDIPYDTINEHAPFLPENSRRARKIYYNLLLDDAAGLESACAQLKEFVDAILAKQPQT